jgi:glycosyltransferase involved in cell wall biosynthesis
MIGETCCTKSTNCRIGEGELRTKGRLKKNYSDTPLLTVITAVFNGEQHLEESILSVLNQTYNNVQYIIIDGGSTDGTLDIIRKYEHRIDYWVSEKDSGIANAWNKALKLTLGQWFVILGADDYFWNDSVLDQFVFRLKKFNGISLIKYGDVNYINQKRIVVAPLRGGEFSYNKFTNQGMFFCHQSVFCHHSLIAKIGSFDENYRFAMDYDFILRALKITTPEYMQNFLVAAFRVDGVSGSYKDILKIRKEYIRIIRSNAISNYLNLQYVLYFKDFIKYLIQKILGDVLRKKIQNTCRILTGRIPI